MISLTGYDLPRWIMWPITYAAAVYHRELDPRDLHQHRASIGSPLYHWIAKKSWKVAHLHCYSFRIWPTWYSGLSDNFPTWLGVHQVVVGIRGLYPHHHADRHLFLFEGLPSARGSNNLSLRQIRNRMKSVFHGFCHQQHSSMGWSIIVPLHFLPKQVIACGALRKTWVTWVPSRPSRTRNKCHPPERRSATWRQEETLPWLGLAVAAVAGSMTGLFKHLGLMYLRVFGSIGTRTETAKMLHQQITGISMVWSSQQLP